MIGSINNLDMLNYLTALLCFNADIFEPSRPTHALHHLIDAKELGSQLRFYFTDHVAVNANANANVNNRGSVNANSNSNNVNVNKEVESKQQLFLREVIKKKSRLGSSDMHLEQHMQNRLLAYLLDYKADEHAANIAHLLTALH